MSKEVVIENTAKAVEHVSVGVLGGFTIASTFQWLNGNSQAVIAMCAIGTFVIAGISQYLRYKFFKKNLGHRRQSD